MVEEGVCIDSACVGRCGWVLRWGCVLRAGCVEDFFSDLRLLHCGIYVLLLCSS